ncbi:response regulator [Candidatus Uhrbacteria bacterium]|jgi:DNA-binding response OmpR family regulator|nr:response regulator [Candidatus Uhrbacteria bacterium]
MAISKNETKRILVVEDEVPLQSAVSRKLKQEGFEVVTVVTAEKALEKLEGGGSFDLIWLDVMLPGMSGIDFLKRVRANSKWKHIAVVIVSNVGSEEVVAQAFELEATVFFVKAEHRLTDIISRVKLIIELPATDLQGAIA